MARKPLHSLYLVALSGTALFMPNLGFAQVHTPELQFYPSQGWNVDSDGGKCDVSGAFNNGFVMSLQGSDAWVETFNMDFKQSIFTAGKAYDVKLSVPGVSEAKFQARATSANNLSFSLKNNKPLYQAMSKNAVIDLNVESNEFRFILTGFPNAASQFERCMAGGGLEAKPVPALREAAADTEAPVNTAEEPQLVARMNDFSTQAEAQTAADAGDLVSRADGSSFVENEAMALEAKAKEAPPTAMIEILPEDTQPVIQQLPYTETTKLKDNIVEQKEVMPGMPDKVMTEVEREAQPMAEVAETIEEKMDVMEEAAITPPAPVAKPDVTQEPILRTEATANAVSKTVDSNRRMSDILAEEIRKNPDMVAMGGGAIALNQTPNKRVAKLEMPPVLDELSPVAAVAASSAPIETAEPEAIITEAPAAELPPLEMADVMLPDESSTPPGEIDEPMMPEPEMDVKDVEPLEAVKPNEKPAPKPIEEAVQVADAKTPKPYKVNREVIRAQADITMLEPAASEDAIELRDRVRDLESQLAALEAENNALNDDLKVTLKESEDELLSISSENWNLERATMRYNEAERQIKRLGQQLQMERAKCAADQKDLESMLFDPQVTGEQQLARLADLEKQLMKAKAELQSERMIFEERIRVLESQGAQ